jgi:hypothetical protein
MTLLESPAWEVFASKDEEVALELAVDLLRGAGAQTWAEQLAGLSRFFGPDSSARQIVSKSGSRNPSAGVCRRDGAQPDLRS